MFSVLQTGIQTTYQDLGRLGFRNMGVPLSGVMDRQMAQFANTLLGNHLDATVIEFTIVGPILEALETVEVVIAGIGFLSSVGGVEVPLNEVVKIEKGSVLKIGTSSQTMRGYLAVKGGFDVIEILGSSSYYKGLTIPEIEKGTTLKIKKIKNTQPNFHSFNTSLYRSSDLKVTKGPEFELLDERLKQELFNSFFNINPQSNRMATLFDNTASKGLKEIITAPVQPGTVQLTPSGGLVVLMRDSQATGGYARIFQLQPEAFCLLSQKIPGTSIGFKLI